MGFANDPNYSGLTGILAPLNGTPTKVQPPDTLQGFKPNQPIAAQHLNWIVNKAISVVGDPIFGLGGDGDLTLGSSDVVLTKDAELNQLSWSPGATGKLKTNGFRLRILTLAMANMPVGGINGDGDPSATEANYTQAGTYAFVVPAGITSLNASVFGAHGGRNLSGTSKRGGRGRVQATIPVTAGETLTLTIGSSGQDFSGNTTNGAGGGGYSAIYRGTTPLIVAGGGGGGGATSANGDGGNGGGTTGGAGSSGNTWGGGGGTPSTGGALGADNSLGAVAGGSAGGALFGGSGRNQSGMPFYAGNGGIPGGGPSGINDGASVSGAGGGGGWFGGGGGGAYLLSFVPQGGGGGGGSSYTDGTLTGITHTRGTGTTSAAQSGQIQFLGLAATATPNGLSGTQGWGQGGLAPGATVSDYLIATGGVGGAAGGGVGASGSGSVISSGKRDVSPLGPTTALAVCGMAGASGPDAVGMPSSPSGGCYVSIRAALIIRHATAAAGCISSNGGAGVKPSGTFAVGFGHGPGGGGAGVVDLIYGDLAGPVVADAIKANGGDGGAGGNASGSPYEGAGGGGGGEGGKIFKRGLFTGSLSVSAPHMIPTSGNKIPNGGGLTGGNGGNGGQCKADL